MLSYPEFAGCVVAITGAAAYINGVVLDVNGGRIMM